ncbi:MAG TPA: DNA mismatch repair protein MutS, partial [Bacillota bacterium]|nr:DNA mismatch repair protein MutS [Bacillota bacterium]
MMRQYRETKAQYPDCLLMFRVGDFFELFYEDAVIAARELNIVLTSRDKKEGEEGTPMAGVPHHALETYLGRLVKKGYKVAICDQVEDPQL